MAGVELVKDRISSSSEWLQERWSDFRARSGFYQARVALLVAYLVVVVGTVVLAPPAPPGYALKIGQVPWGFSQRTYLDITNLRLGDVEEAVVEVHGVVVEFDGKQSRGPWMHHLKRFPEGEQARVWPENLLDARNRPAGNNLRIERVVLRSDGEVLFEHLNVER